MTQRDDRVLLTPEVEALIGRSTDVLEMHDLVDRETIRRHVRAIPDQDPRHWDEELAKPRYGGVTTPPMLTAHIAQRTPPDVGDDLNELMLEDWFRDDGGRTGARHFGRSLPSVRSVAGTRSQLNAGEEVELYRYPLLGDRIFYQARYSGIQERRSRSGRPMLMVITETRYWNQNDETIMILRTTGMEL